MKILRNFGGFQAVFATILISAVVAVITYLGYLWYQSSVLAANARNTEAIIKFMEANDTKNPSDKEYIASVKEAAKTSYGSARMLLYMVISANANEKEKTTEKARAYLIDCIQTCDIDDELKNIFRILEGSRESLAYVVENAGKNDMQKFIASRNLAMNYITEKQYQEAQKYIAKAKEVTPSEYTDVIIALEAFVQEMSRPKQ